MRYVRGSASVVALSAAAVVLLLAWGGLTGASPAMEERAAPGLIMQMLGWFVASAQFLGHFLRDALMLVLVGSGMLPWIIMIQASLVAIGGVFMAMRTSHLHAHEQRFALVATVVAIGVVCASPQVLLSPSAHESILIGLIGAMAVIHAPIIGYLVQVQVARVFLRMSQAQKRAQRRDMRMAS